MSEPTFTCFFHKRKDLPWSQVQEETLCNVDTWSVSSPKESLKFSSSNDETYRICFLIPFFQHSFPLIFHGFHRHVKKILLPNTALTPSILHHAVHSLLATFELEDLSQWNSDVRSCHCRPFCAVKSTAPQAGYEPNAGPIQRRW